MRYAEQNGFNPVTAIQSFISLFLLAPFLFVTSFSFSFSFSVPGRPVRFKGGALRLPTDTDRKGHVVHSTDNSSSVKYNKVPCSYRKFPPVPQAPV